MKIIYTRIRRIFLILFLGFGILGCGKYKLQQNNITNINKLEKPFKRTRLLRESIRHYPKNSLNSYFRKPSLVKHSLNNYNYRFNQNNNYKTYIKFGIFFPIFGYNYEYFLKKMSEYEFKEYLAGTKYVTSVKYPHTFIQSLTFREDIVTNIPLFKQILKRGIICFDPHGTFNTEFIKRMIEEANDKNFKPFEIFLEHIKDRERETHEQLTKNLINDYKEIIEPHVIKYLVEKAFEINNDTFKYAFINNKKNLCDYHIILPSIIN